METSETEIPTSTKSTIETVNPHPETPDGPKGNSGDVTSSKEIIAEHEEIVPVKEVIEILNVELVTPGRDTLMETEIAEDKMNCEEMKFESHNNNKEMQEEEDKNEKQEVTSTIEMRTKTIEQSDTNKVIDNDQSIAEEATDTGNTCTTTTGLDLLAQYDSDNDDGSSDSNSVIEVPISSNQDYRNQVVEINSETDSNDSDSEVEYLSELRKTIEKRMETMDDGEEEDEGDDNEENVGKKKLKPKLKVKGEFLLEDLPPIQDLKITVPEDECIEFGKIHSIVDQLVLVSALPNSILLDLETVLFLEKGQKVLGEVFDVLGQVADPLYCIRFNSNKQIKEKEINIGDTVYVAPKTQYTQYVILSSLMKQKGSDASWENDIEPPPRFLDYSDDEQEQLAKRQLRNKDRPIDNDDPTKRPRTTDDDDVASISGRSHNSTQHRSQRGGNRSIAGGHYNHDNRARNYASNQYSQHPPNYHRGSWHSNYYRQPFPPPSQPPVNYNMSSNQSFPSQYPLYPLHSMPYTPPPTQYGPPPPMMHQHSPQMIPNAFNVRPATVPGPHISHVPPFQQQQYTSPPPPPPGSQ
ncbi:hypothetical protein DOY81_000149 [Sarcophaga bullata]|nr:hypothetical protein DOY81_000149 [Sarcophaga bullata]